MSKRLHKDVFPSEEQGHQAPSKRQDMTPTVKSSEDALSLLLSHADHLVDRIGALKSQTTDLSSASQGRLLGDFRKLSNALLPAVKFLADHESTEGHKEGKPVSNLSASVSFRSSNADLKSRKAIQLYGNQHRLP